MQDKPTLSVVVTGNVDHADGSSHLIAQLRDEHDNLLWTHYDGAREEIVNLLTSGTQERTDTLNSLYPNGYLLQIYDPMQEVS